MPTASVYEVRASRRDRVRLLLAVCDRCEADVMHGGGDLDGPVLLGERSTHCGCPGFYRLVLGADVDGEA